MSNEAQQDEVHENEVRENEAPRVEDQDWRSQAQQALEQEFASLTARLTTLSADDDRQLDASEVHTQAVLVENTRRSLAEVSQALRRMAEGRYGACAHCGDQIPQERLEVLPHARYCLPCQRTRG